MHSDDFASGSNNIPEVKKKFNLVNVMALLLVNQFMYENKKKYIKHFSYKFFKITNLKMIIKHNTWTVVRMDDCRQG